MLDIKPKPYGRLATVLLSHKFKSVVLAGQRWFVLVRATDNTTPSARLIARSFCFGAVNGCGLRGRPVWVITREFTGNKNKSVGRPMPLRKHGRGLSGARNLCCVNRAHRRVVNLELQKRLPSSGFLPGYGSANRCRKGATSRSQCHTPGLQDTGEKERVVAVQGCSYYQGSSNCRNSSYSTATGFMTGDAPYCKDIFMKGVLCLTHL